MKVLNYSSFCSFILLSLLSVLFFIPIVLKHSNVSAVATQSETNLSITTPLDVSLAFEVDNKDGTFSSSVPSTFGVVTNNSSGYNLSIYPNATNTTTYDKLVNTEDDSYYFTSISSASSEAEFKVSNWGYKVTKTIGEINANTIDGTMYQPAPSTAGTILDITTTANSNKAVVEQDKYAITLGVKADYVHLPIGTYTNTFTLIAVANPVNYQVTYNKNTDDEVEGLPNTQAGDINNDDIVLSSTKPTRAHYSFLGWCNITPTTNNGIDACTGTNATTYQPGDTFHLDKTKDNNLTLKAMWKIDQHTCIKQYRLQNANGTWGSYTADTTEKINYGATCTYSKTVTNYKGSDNGSNGSAATTSGVMADTGLTLQVSMYRNTNTVSLSKGTGISAVTVTGSGVKSGSGTASATVYYEGDVTINASIISGYTWVNWTGSATYSNQAQSISRITGPRSFTANGVANANGMQTMSISNCSGIKTDTRDGKTYGVASIGGICWMTKNLDLAGGTTLTSAKSNVSSNFTLPNSSTSGFTSYTTAYVYNSSRTDCSAPGCYSYYSWTAATAGTNGSSYDICPKGWKLPTIDDFNALKSIYTTTSALKGSPFYAVLAGVYATGGSFRYGGSHFTYWSSNSYNSTEAYAFYNDMETPGGERIGVWDNVKRFGSSVRCVKK